MPALFRSARCLRAWVVPVALCAATAALPAQEAGVYATLGNSDLTELGQLRGAGGYFRATPLRYLALRVDVYRHNAAAIMRDGLVCNNYTLKFNCMPERIRNASAFQGAAASASLVVPVGSFVEVEAGGGVSLNEISAGERTQSGRASFLVYGKSAQPAVLGRAAVRVKPLPRLPLLVDLSFDAQRVSMNGCSTDQLAYAPYCKTLMLREWRLGLGYRLW